MSKWIRVHVAHVLTDGIGDNSVQPRSKPRLRRQWLVLCRVGPPKVFSFLLFFLELQTTIFKWIGATPTSHVKLWNLRIETTICKWTFQVIMSFLHLLLWICFFLQQKHILPPCSKVRSKSQLQYMFRSRSTSSWLRPGGKFGCGSESKRCEGQNGCTKSDGLS